MRTLKCRVLDKTRNILCYGISNFQFGFLDNQQVIKYVDLPGEPNGYFLNSGEFVIQQFTGLKDKNNKDIFEGDILKVKTYDGWFDNVGYHYNSIVFYDEKSAAYRHGFNPKLGGSLFMEDSQTKILDIEVIGNVFENDNLIKE